MKRTILIADDDTKYLALLSRTLKRGGFEVLTTSDGCDVSEMLARRPVDVLVLDLQMPGMNGWEVLRRLRDPLCAAQLRAPARRPKIVVVSGRNEDETASFVRQLGVDAYLTKPFWSEQILDTLRTVLAS